MIKHHSNEEQTLDSCQQSTKYYHIFYNIFKFCRCLALLLNLFQFLLDQTELLILHCLAIVLLIVLVMFYGSLTFVILSFYFLTPLCERVQ